MMEYLEEWQSEVAKEVGKWAGGLLRSCRLRSDRPGWSKPWRLLEVLRWSVWSWRLDKLLLLGRTGNTSSWGGQLGEVGERINVNGIGSLLSLISYINTFLWGNQVDKLITVLTNNHRSKRKRWIRNSIKEHKIHCCTKKVIGSIFNNTWNDRQHRAMLHHHCIYYWEQLNMLHHGTLVDPQWWYQCYFQHW